MINLNRLRKEEILWLVNHKCRHRHRYIEHITCFEAENPPNQKIATEKIGFLDIETTGLNANFDYVISYAIYDSYEKKIYGRVLKKNEVLRWNVLDRKLMTEFCDDVNRFDRIVVYWGKDRRHDIPFLRTRCIKNMARFPFYKEICLTDAYDICKNKLRIDHYRLENVCRFLGIPAKQHPLNADIWQKAKLGDSKSLNYIWKHNQEDVISLAGVYEQLKPYAKEGRVSI